MIPFDRPVADIIRMRRSWRTYRPEPVDEASMGLVRQMLARQGMPPFGSRVRIVLMDRRGSPPAKVKGTYGVVRGATSFLVGAIEKDVSRFEDFGYLFEETILYATSLGLGTCWMGGTFDRALFGEASGIEPGEIVPAVSPVGVPASKRSAVDSLFVLAAGSRTRKAFGEIFFKDTFAHPLNERMAGPYAQALEMVRLAPSSSNRQPWRVVMAGDSFHFFLRRTPLYGRLFGAVDLQRIDMGIAMYHFERTLKDEGIVGRWREMPGAAEGAGPWTEYVVSFVP